MQVFAEVRCIWHAERRSMILVETAAVEVTQGGAPFRSFRGSPEDKTKQYSTYSTKHSTVN